MSEIQEPAHTDVNNLSVPTRSEYAHALHQRISQCAQELGKQFYKLSEYLSIMKEYRLWEELGYDSFSQYLASVDTRLSLGQVNMGIRVLRGFFKNEPVYAAVTEAVREINKDVDLTSLPPSKLDDVLPAVQKLVSQGQTRDAAELVLSARTPNDGGLSRTDLYERLVELGFKPRSTRTYLCLKSVSQADIIETETPEGLFAQYDIILVEPRFVKGKPQCQNAQQ